MKSNLTEYFEALERLQSDVPKVLPVGTRITNDAVSIEAGRKKGSIKRSRTTFGALIQAIDIAASMQARRRDSSLIQVAEARESAANYRRLYEEAIAREISLLHEVQALKQRLKLLNG